MGGPFRTQPARSRRREKAFLVGIVRKSRLPFPADEDSLEELKGLAQSAGAQVVGSTTQKIQAPNPALFIGSGKALDIGRLAGDMGADLVIIDEDLSPSQQRNLEDIIKKKVVDRTGLILDIFSQRARTREGKLQVEYAQLSYILPRLAGKGESLSQLAGGIGTRGPGETQLEVDRRKVRTRMGKISRDLEVVRKTRQVHRDRRRDLRFPVIALVGYTNAGKSTLMNALTGSDVVVADMLFATLDPTIRQISLGRGRHALLSDTVGFISKLPHQLVEAFKATLEEVVNADVLLHVVDVSHPACARQVESVNTVLEEMGITRTPILYALNKMDRVPDPLLARSLYASLTPSAAISAKTGAGLEALRDMISLSLDTARRG